MKYIFLFLIYSGMILTDLPLSRVIGTIGSSPMIIFAPILFITILYSAQFKYKGTELSNLFLYYLLVSLFASLILFIYYAIVHQTMYSPFNQLILIKLVDASIYNLIYFFAYTVLVNLFLRMKIKRINQSIFFVFIVCIIIGLIEILDKNILNFIHLTAVDYSRLRLSTSEPSRAFYLFEVVSLLSLFVTNNKAIKIVIFIMMAIFMPLIASKGGIVFLFLSILIIYLFGTSLKQKIVFSVLLIPLLGFFIYIILTVVVPALTMDIDKFTSFSTRLVTSVWAILSLFYFPLGEGYGTYMCYFKDLLVTSADIIKSISPIPLSLVEINSMIDTGVNVAVKSGILFQIVQNGFIAVVFFYLLFKKSWKNIKHLNISAFNKNLLRIILFFTILTLLFGANMGVLYIYILPIAYIERLKLQGRDN